jgi:hypothetical protein
MIDRCTYNRSLTFVDLRVLESSIRIRGFCYCFWPAENCIEAGQ